jgi:single-stranded DNA-binding protein
MPLPPSLNRVILLGWVAKTRIGTNQHGQRYFTFTLATSRFVDNNGSRGSTSDMHYVTIFGDDNVKRAAKEITYKANVMIEGFLRYLDKRDPDTGQIKQRYTYIQVDYWQVAKPGDPTRPHAEHSTQVRDGVDADALARIDRNRDRGAQRREDEGA